MYLKTTRITLVREMYDKKFNQWHINYVLDILKSKRDESRGSDTNGNL